MRATSCTRKSQIGYELPQGSANMLSRVRLNLVALVGTHPLGRSYRVIDTGHHRLSIRRPA